MPTQNTTPYKWNYVPATLIELAQIKRILKVFNKNLFNTFFKNENKTGLKQYSFIFLLAFLLSPETYSHQAGDNGYSNPHKLKSHKNQKWVGTWSSSPQSNMVFLDPYSIPPLENQTIRNVVRVSLGGNITRVRFTNTYGNKNLDIGSASIGVRENESDISPNTLKALRFGGKATISIPPGAEIYSDPVELAIESDSDVAVNIFISGISPLPTIDDITNKSSYILSGGDYTMSEQSPSNTEMT
ncbi:MAG: hypothetical protein JKY93_02050, partial [Gammaproteobacteria bacterium]|nr:hypothetical protein [Gammaproteobacteria bacterium]